MGIHKSIYRWANKWERRELFLTVGLPTDTFRMNGQIRKSPIAHRADNTWFRQEPRINAKSSLGEFDWEWIIHKITRYLF